MSSPTTLAWQNLKRLCRYFSGAPRLVYKFPRQNVDYLDTYTDTDWGGCVKTRKSTSGGVTMLGAHCLKHWSSTQSSVTLSSGEAEFHGLVKGAAVSLGQQALYEDLGVQVGLRLWTDSSAAVGICSRQGLGKLRHVDTKTLWLQQAVRVGRLEVRKVPGVSNPADLLTKHSLSKDRILELIRLIGCTFRDGRPAAAPQLRQGQCKQLTMAEAEEQGLTELVADVELALPIMPHLAMSVGELDRHYPALIPPAEVDDPDPDALVPDPCYAHGLKIASQIEQDMVQLGRTRKDGAVRGGDTKHGSSSSAEGRIGIADQTHLNRIGTSEPGTAALEVVFGSASALPGGESPRLAG